MADPINIIEPSSGTFLSVVSTKTGVAVIVGPDGGQEYANHVADALNRVVLADNGRDPEKPVFALIDADAGTLTEVTGLRRFEA